MPLPYIVIILYLFYSIATNASQLPTAQWISHSKNRIPQEDTMSAIGSHNGTIFLLGGFDKRRQKTNYDIKSDSFVLYQSYFFPTTAKVFGEAQYWTQIGFNLYILDDLDPHNNKISVYNMADNSFISKFDSIPVTKSDGMGRACIASSDVYNEIFINGGITNTGMPIKETHVLNVETMSWHLSAQMQTARRSHSCIIMQDVLYSIGGSSAESLLTTIEKISIIDVHDNKWIYLNGTLSAPLTGLRSFIYGKNIHIIGGLDQSRKFYDTIHIIDTTTDIVTLCNDKLAFPTVYAAVIMVNNIMYAFGGGFRNDNWQSQTISASSITATVIPDLDTTFSDFADFTTTQLVEEDSGLSVGGKVGVIFAIVLMVCLLIVAAFFFISGKIKQLHDYDKTKNNEFEKVDDFEKNHYINNLDRDNMVHSSQSLSGYEKNEHINNLDRDTMVNASQSCNGYD